MLSDQPLIVDFPQDNKIPACYSCTAVGGLVFAQKGSHIARYVNGENFQ